MFRDNSQTIAQNTTPDNTESLPLISSKARLEFENIIEGFRDRYKQ